MRQVRPAHFPPRPLWFGLALAGVMSALALGGCGTQQSNDVCEPGYSICFVYSEFVLVCRDDGSGWDAVACPEDTLCYEGICQDLTCVPGDAECRDEGVVTCRDDGTGWTEPEPCDEGQRCAEGECREVICQPGELRCDDEGRVERCVAAGTEWEIFQVCPEGTTCFEGGVCLSETCDPGQTECGQNTLYTCNEAGEWESHPCPDDQPCIFGRCVECVSDAGCAEGQVCEDGVCLSAELEIATEALPPGTVGAPYEAALEAAGGLRPYAWAVIDGALPPGLAFSPEGRLSGVPETAAVTPLTIQVTDSEGAMDSRDYELQVFAEGPVHITTEALPPADHGIDYEFDLGAAGGVRPYAWQILEGGLPAGLRLTSDGTITGVPDEIGSFPMVLRVIDGSTPPGTDTRELALEVRVSPLEIYGDTEYDLLLLKVVILPMLVPYIPYSTNLQARGGIEPYTWSIEEPPRGISWLISEWGLPDDMSLGERGRISGWVTDVSDAQTISIPFGPELAGYFFYGRVVDSQEPSDEDEAIFCIPTVAL